MRGAVAVGLLVGILGSTPADADPKVDRAPGQPAEAPSAPDTMLTVGAQAGMEGSGALLLVEAGVGGRYSHSTTINVRGAWSLYGGPLGGGSSDLSSRYYELRAGPTWWSCGNSACVGLGIECGLELQITDEGSRFGPLIARERQFWLLCDNRLRAYLPPHRPFALEFSVGFRLKARLHDSLSSETSSHSADPIGAGVTFGLAAIVMF